MNIELVKVDENEKEVFKNIYEFYLYEMSKYFEYDVDENGKFYDSSTDQYINSRKEPILIKKDGKYAGFFLISKKYDIDVIEEFGIMPKYRSGFFTYKVIKEYFLRGDKTTKFMILNENKEWLKCIEYMLNKNNDICKIVEKKEVIFHHSKEKKYKFTSFLVEHV